MARLGSWVKPFPEGIYVDAGRRLDRSLAAQGRARSSPTAMPIMPAAATTAVWATPETLAIMDCRYGPQAGTPVAYGEIDPARRGGRQLRPRRPCPRLGPDRARTCGEKIVVSGDYKRRPDPTCAPFEPVPCDIFITEATFGLPVFRHPATAGEVDRLLQRLHDNPERCILVGAYALGKAQRLIMELRGRGHHDPIYIHGALQRLCDLYAEFGVPLGELRPATGVAEGRAEGHGSSSPRPARSTTAGRGACPIRSPPWRRAGCGSASAPASGSSRCR